MNSRLPVHWVDPDPATAPPPRGHLAAVACLADVFFETAAGPPPAGRVAWMCEELRVAFADASIGSRLLYRIMLWLVCTIAPLLALRLWPLRFMGRPARLKALDRFERSPFAMALYATKAILAIRYYEHPDSAREAGFDGLPKVDS